MIQKNQDLNVEYEVLKFDVPVPLARAAEGHVDYTGGDVTPDEERIPLKEKPVPGGPTVYPLTRRLTQRIPIAETTFPVLNESEKVLLLVDEAHRDNAGDFMPK